jgi:predicted CoA-binding protein
LNEAEILKQYSRVAVVGASDDPERPSNIVINYLNRHGYNVIPVNPKASQIMGRQAYADLLSIPEKVEIVDIFRKSEEVGEIVEQAIKIGARVVWMQEGVINEEAAARARAAGLDVVMDKCMKKTHEKYYSA